MKLHSIDYAIVDVKVHLKITNEHIYLWHKYCLIFFHLKLLSNSPCDDTFGKSIREGKYHISDILNFLDLAIKLISRQN